ncbi:cytochrome P450 2K1-like [Pholidichthys leucotaenia]
MEIFNLFLQSSTFISLFGALLVLALFQLFLPNCGSKLKEPPGPRPLPVIGNLLQVDLNRLYMTFLEFSKQYGPVFMVHLGPSKAVVLSGFRTVKEALCKNNKEFGERSPVRILDEFIQGHGIVWANGESWRDIRRFAISKFKDFGMGKEGIENKITAECFYLTELVKQSKGEAFDVLQSLQKPVSNITCCLIYGKRFEYDDPEFRSLIDRTCRNNFLLFRFSVQLYNLFPWIGKWFSGTREFQKAFAASRKQHLELIRHLEETLDPQRCRGLVDTFLVHKSRLEESGITDSHFNSENLVMTVMNLFVGGTDTTARTLRNGLELMARYPEIQDQVHEEVSRVIGEGQVRAKDRLNLSFTNAVIHEIQRLTGVAPLALPHRVKEDMIFQGYYIKKGTRVFPSLISVLRDESEWEHPNTFYPAHFLDKDGKFIKREAFMAFSAGERVCLGESLARMELFIFFSTLIQHFRFTSPPGVPVEDLNLHHPGSFIPSLEQLCAVPRM